MQTTLLRSRRNNRVSVSIKLVVQKEEKRFIIVKREEEMQVLAFVVNEWTDFRD